ncbi:hypothetical protein PLICRDRAFT_558618 [Plicaturopsis crispa FD-325 SS-3]|nr:hypothetical protein PLICRDRAFT_558618 [Plicaturopsis crispa FD-325 SS-3]
MFSLRPALPLRQALKRKPTAPHIRCIQPSKFVYSRRTLNTGHPRAQAAAALHAIEAHRPQPIADADETPIVSTDDSRVAIGWDTRTWSRFNFVWLRDHCRCPSCFHSVTKQRLVDTFAIPPDIKPLHVEPTPDGLHITWPESPPHEALYPWSWLRTNSYDPSFARPPSEKILWGSKIAQAPPRVTFEDVMNAEDGRGVWRWLRAVDKFGFCFVSGVPTTPEATEALSRRIGFIRETQYGRFWDFTSDFAKGDTAYTSLALSAHTDNTYFTDPSGLQLFHLLSHEGTGGSTLLVDGFYTASLLRSLHPDLHAVLARVPVPAHAAGEPGALYKPKLAKPALEYVGGPDGELVHVRWNNHDRSALRDVAAGDVESWYAAARTWNSLLTSADSEYWVQLEPGTAIAFIFAVIDNHRVLHGRSAFTGARRMCGAYIGWDEYRSRFSVLEEKYGATQGAGGIWSSDF